MQDNTIEEKEETDMMNLKIKHMVFIDDDAVNNFLMKTRLETYGYDGDARFFDKAKSALLYLEELEGVKPDVIFLDIKMPEMDGFEFLDAFRQMELNKKIPAKIFMVSSSTNQRDRKRSQESGLVQGFIEKPLSIDRIGEIENNYFQ